jgi:hypothetical protein
MAIYQRGGEMWTDTACEALAKARVLELSYDGYSRSVEVHAVGFSKEGHAIMRVWQTGGGSVSNEPVGWKLLRLDEAGGAHITNTVSSAPRIGYRQNDRAMTRIVCQI